MLVIKCVDFRYFQKAAVLERRELLSALHIGDQGAGHLISSRAIQGHLRCPVTPESSESRDGNRAELLSRGSEQHLGGLCQVDVPGLVTDKIRRC